MHLPLPVARAISFYPLSVGCVDYPGSRVQLVPVAGFSGSVGSLAFGAQFCLVPLATCCLAVAGTMAPQPSPGLLVPGLQCGLRPHDVLSRKRCRLLEPPRGWCDSTSFALTTPPHLLAAPSAPSPFTGALQVPVPSYTPQCFPPARPGKTRDGASVGS